MDSTALTSAQLHALATRLAHHRAYLARLRARMSALGFPDGDPLAAAIRRATDGADAAYHTAARLEELALLADAPSKRAADVMKRHPPPDQ
ncbi:MAG TPA: hypothetical protein VEA69_22360 [Tepidisphaeraceae bacterium]|nr:hypothetical protein [Tepidisphaeraceae bacterium]